MNERTDIDVIKQRKLDGLNVPLHKQVQAKTTSTYLEYVGLVHNALPELNFDEIDTSATFLNHNFSAPLIIDSMTGGTPEAAKINERLAETAEELGLGMGLGSQRAGLKSKALAETYSIAREHAPNAFLIANIGGAQLAKGMSVDEVTRIIDMINADALVVHLNPLQELIQPEGEPVFRAVYQKIADLVKVLNVPVIAKEVGAGISKEVALKLQVIGIKAINVAGSGGTSWAGVEKLRAESMGDELKMHLGEMFWDWGIPTAVSLIEVKKAVELPLIASGGLRNGLEVAKSLSIGADMCAMALPFLKQASISKDSVMQFVSLLLNELKSAMYLVGAENVKALKGSRHVLTGPLADWFK